MFGKVGTIYLFVQVTEKVALMESLIMELAKEAEDIHKALSSTLPIVGSSKHAFLLPVLFKFKNQPKKVFDTECSSCWIQP